uniref:Uncharacterized protein n=1 Tax=Myripristis murdjan TaxID=586833 RepID=A0A667ZJ52_9TELE
LRERWRKGGMLRWRQKQKHTKKHSKLSLTGVKCCFEDSYFVDSPLLYFFNALADYVRHLGALAPVEEITREISVTFLIMWLRS